MPKDAKLNIDKAPDFSCGRRSCQLPSPASPLAKVRRGEIFGLSRKSTTSLHKWGMPEFENHAEHQVL